MSYSKQLQKLECVIIIKLHPVLAPKTPAWTKLFALFNFQVHKLVWGEILAPSLLFAIPILYKDICEFAFELGWIFCIEFYKCDHKYSVGKTLLTFEKE